MPETPHLAWQAAARSTLMQAISTRFVSARFFESPRASYLPTKSMINVGSHVFCKCVDKWITHLEQQEIDILAFNA